MSYKQKLCQTQPKSRAFIGGRTLGETALLFAVLVALVYPTMARAQTGQGAIEGKVVDSIGALVQGATVAIRNDETLSVLALKTNSAGVFNALSLVPGSYTVTVVQPGFEQSVLNGVRVGAAQTVGVNLTLTVGKGTSSVIVTSQSSLLSRDTSDVATTVDHAIVQDLPYPERSALEAVLLIPGVNGDPLQPGGIQTENPNYTTSTVTPGSTITVGGSAPGTSSILVDGSDVTQASYPRAGVNLSNRDVQETTVIVTGLSAKYGRTGSGVIVETSQPGTSVYHGALTWRHTDPYFNAYPLGGTLKNDIHENFYGGYLGGPVFIPRLYSKRHRTFFFVGIEPGRLRNTVGFRAALPTPADLAGKLNDSLPFLDSAILKSAGYAAAVAAPRIGGVFFHSPTTLVNGAAFPLGGQYGSTSQYVQTSGPLADCSAAFLAANPTLTACPNDVSAQLAQNKFAQFVLSKFPTPSNPGPNVIFDNSNGTYAQDSNNVSTSRGVRNTDNRYSLRIDQQFSNADSMFVRYTVIPVVADRFYAVAATNPINQTPTDSALTHDLALGYTHLFNSSLVNDFHYSFLRVHQERLAPGSATTQDFAAAYGLTPATFGAGFPNLGSLGYAVQPGNFTAQIQLDQDFIAGDDLTLTRGNHLFQFGVDIRWIQSNDYDLSGETGGKYQFNQSVTNNGTLVGSPLGALILGEFSSFSNTPVPVPSYYRWHYYAGYFQDDWRILPNLTLNIGLRYEVETPRREKFNNQALVNTTTQGTLNGMATTAAFCFSGACGMGRGLWPTNYFGFEPRIGFSYSLTPRTTIRAAYTLTRLPLTGYENFADPNFNVASASVGGNNGGVVPNTIVDWITNPVGPLTSAYKALNGKRGPFFSSNNLPVDYVQQSNAVPYNQTWSLTLQYEPAPKTLLQATYEGLKGTHLIGYFGGALNVPALSTIVNAIHNQVNLNALSPNTYGIKQNGAILMESALQKLNPYQNFFNLPLTTIYPRNGASNYNGLYLSATQRLNAGLSLLASYTWQKSLDDVPEGNAGNSGGFGYTSPQDPTNLHGDYSVSTFDQPSRFRLGYTYNLPLGIGERFRTHNGIIDRIIGNISTSGFYTVSSGFPNYVTLGNNGYYSSLLPAGVGGCSPTGTKNFCNGNAGLPTGYTLRPNIVPGVKLRSANWKKGAFSTDPTPYLNPAAFATPGSYNNPQLGNAPRTLSNARSPRETFFDARVVKGFTIRNQYKLNVDATFNNALNHPVYFGINNHTLSTETINYSAPANNPASAFTFPAQGTFAFLNQGQTAGLSRIIRVGAEFVF